MEKNLVIFAAVVVAVFIGSFLVYSTITGQAIGGLVEVPKQPVKEIPANLEIEVRDSGENAVMHGAEVRYKQTAILEVGEVPAEGLALTGCNGKVFFTELEPGRYEVTTSKNMYRAKIGEFEVKSGQNVQAVTLDQAYGKSEPIYLQSNEIIFNDKYGVGHNAPFWYELNLDTSGSSFKYDGRTIYYATDFNQDFNFTMATSYVTKTSSQAGVEYIEPFNSLPGKTMHVPVGGVSECVELKGKNDYTIRYAIYVPEGGDSFYLLLCRQTHRTSGNNTWSFAGTDTSEDGAVNKTVYWRNNAYFGAGGVNSNYIAHFKIGDGSQEGIEAYFDTSDDKIFKCPNPELSVYMAPVLYDGTCYLGCDGMEWEGITKAVSSSIYASRADGGVKVIIPLVKTSG